MPVTEEYLAFSGRRIRLLRDGTGPPLLLIHGIGASADWWLPNFPSFTGHLTTYAVDLPGFGSSHPSEAADLLAPEDFVSELLDSLGIQRAAVIGHSLGGYVALRFAARYPDRITGLVLVDSAGFGPLVYLPLRLLVLPVIGELLFTLRRIATPFFIRTLFYDPRKIPADLLTISERYASEPDFASTFLRILRSGIDVAGGWKLEPASRLLSSVISPILIIWGAQDPLFSVQRIRPLADHFDVQIFDLAGHVPQIEHADDFARVVLAKIVT